MNINAVSLLRSLAMLSIVICHSLDIAGWDDYAGYSYLSLFFRQLVAGGTIFLIFLSGYIFFKLHENQYEFGRFIRSKYVAFFIPYLIISIPALLLKVKGIDFESGFDFWQVITVIIHSYATGSHMFGYWFIPIIMVIYLLSPVIRIFLKYYGLSLVSILPFWILLASVIGRSIENEGFFQNLFYYTPVFILGSVVAKYQNEILGFIKKNTKICGVILIVVFIPGFLHPDYMKSLHKEAFEWVRFDVIIIKNVILAVILFPYLSSLKLRRIWFFHVVSISSFSIYLIHPWIVSIVSYDLGLMGVAKGSGEILSVVSVIFFSALVFLLTMIVAISVKLISKEKSKAIIGW